MTSGLLTNVSDAVDLDREQLALWALVLNTEAIWLLAYLVATNSSPALLHLYPFVWLNVGALAIVKTRPAPTGRSTRRRALAVAVAYFAVLGFVGGLYGLVSTPVGLPPAGFRVVVLSLPPGWSPTVVYQGSGLRLALFPYKLVGYAALSYLVYATVIDASGSAVSGLLGLLSCVSCTWPIVASVLTGVVGGAGAVAALASAQSYALSTVVFVVTVALLYWRPFGTGVAGEST